MSGSPGNWLIIVGVGLVALGVLVRLGLLSWFGHLPGDIRIEGESVRIYVPIVSMLVISILASGLLYVIRRIV
jgi:hypothetical protein